MAIEIMDQKAVQKALFARSPVRKKSGLPKAKSHLEEEFRQQAEFEDLPTFEREYRFHPSRQWRFDFAWPARKIAVECEGGLFVMGRHNRPISMEADFVKYNAATELGWMVGRFSKRMIASGEAVAWAKRMLSQSAAAVAGAATR